ncbi:HD-GYP domain-containing protein [Pseudorhodoferax soli]|uniref:HD domain-containing protein n=1 Tax=Pseudorhodoferax soli TaxID=545864 RepID=A0A368XXU0_9BURK|nr:HD domain-containing phosphohydrolase [Pseudorhodoferax soli]RCW72910.1 HD domain-containing protein [Pseudorhodoferax soli]
MSSNFQEAVQQLVDDRPPTAVNAIYSSQGIKLIERGAKVDPRLYERLMRHQLSAPLEDALQAQDSINGKALRGAAEDLIERRPVLAALLQHGGHQAQLLDALEAIPLPAPVAFQLSVARDVHPPLFQYALCTALLAGWLVLRPGMVRYDTIMPMAAGLLQDLGMMHIDHVLLQPKGELTPEQRRQLYSHPLISALLLERHHEYPRELIRAVREHHELLDGSGYPAHLAGDRISPWGRVVSLAQVMSALLRPGRALSALRLSLLLRTNRHQFDPALGDRVLNALRDMGGKNALVSVTGMAALEQAGSPVSQLIAFDRLLAAWPATLGRDASATPARVQGMAAIGQQCEQMRRLLADVGASGDQLLMLGGDQDADLMGELSLIAQEMAWQLRTLARNASRRWAPAPGEELPAALAAWGADVDTCLAGLA